jgi:hypothetical protein
MPERNKATILARLQQERKKLIQTLDSLKPEQFDRPGVVGNWSVKDVLAHLAHWEESMIYWVQASRKGKNVNGPEEGLNWDQISKFNAHIFAAHQDESLPEVMKYFHAAHAGFMKMAEGLSDDELLIRGYYPLTENATIYAWLSQYAAHDHWGRSKIDDWLKGKKAG